MTRAIAQVDVEIYGAAFYPLATVFYPFPVPHDQPCALFIVLKYTLPCQIPSVSLQNVQ